jgi:hypothetical protein
MALKHAPQDAESAGNETVGNYRIGTGQTN